MVLIEHKFQIAAPGDQIRIFKRLLAIREQFPHFLLAFEIKFLRLKPHTVGIIYSLTRLNAQQNILHFGILTP